MPVSSQVDHSNTQSYALSFSRSLWTLPKPSRTDHPQQRPGNKLRQRLWPRIFSCSIFTRTQTSSHQITPNSNLSNILLILHVLLNQVPAALFTIQLPLPNISRELQLMRLKLWHSFIHLWSRSLSPASYHPSIQAGNKCLLTIRKSKQRFVHCKMERLISSVTGSRALWSLAKAAPQNLSSNFPPTCDLPDDLRESWEFRFQLHFNRLSYSSIYYYFD